jgi:hypothetical protein
VIGSVFFVMGPPKDLAPGPVSLRGDGNTEVVDVPWASSALLCRLLLGLDAEGSRGGCTACALSLGALSEE